MSLEWAFCHSPVSEITQAGRIIPFAKYSLLLERSDVATPSYQSLLELGKRVCGIAPQSLGNVICVTLPDVTSGTACSESITGASEPRHESTVMGQIPAELAWSARFSPNQRLL